jgi:hypothetical protein
MKTLVQPMMLTALAAILSGAAAANAGPPTPNYAFVHGHWWNGSGYEERTVYTVDGLIYKRICQEHFSPSAGGADFFRDIQPLSP